MNLDPIDDLLDDPAPLPDDGFTMRVMAALPAPRPAPRPSERWLSPLATGLVAAALAPDAAALVRSLAADWASFGEGLAHALVSGAGGLQVPMPLLVVGVAMAATAIGSWLVLEPS